VRFILDNDVPVSVRTMLLREGHEAWSAYQAGLADAADDDLTVYEHRRTCNDGAGTPSAGTSGSAVPNRMLRQYCESA
jgi:hypothetical protein